MHIEVGAVDELLQQLGGIDCGWDPREHAAYMRLRVQCLGLGEPGATIAPNSSAEGSAAGGVGPASGAAGAGLSTPRGDGGLGGALEGSLEAPSPPSRMSVLLERAGRELPGRDAREVMAHEKAVARREAALARRREIVSAWRRRRSDEAAAAKAAAEAEAEAALLERARHGVATHSRRRREVEARERELEGWKEKKLVEMRAKAEAEERAAEAKRQKEAAELERRQAIKDALSARAMRRTSF